MNQAWPHPVFLSTGIGPRLGHVAKVRPITFFHENLYVGTGTDLGVLLYMGKIWGKPYDERV